MIRRTHLLLWLLSGLLLSLPLACRERPPIPTPPPAATATRMVPTASAEPALPTATATVPATVTPSPQSPAEVQAAPTWPAAATPLPPFAAEPPTADEVRTAQALAAARPPERDDVRLAREYQGVGELPARPESAVSLLPGARSPFNVLNIDSNTIVPISATLVGISDYAYFWFDDASPQPERTALIPIEDAFDQIYESGVAAFGPEESPGLDGDDRVHILHASPAALCDQAAQCGLAGYFSAQDNLPRMVSAPSNERKMFVMNADNFGTDFYLNVLAHEFRHMIEDNYDVADIDWEVEGSAMLAEELAGFTANAYRRGNAFLAEPDQQLNRWTDGSTYTHYGQGYVLNRYIYDRLGPDLYRDFATNPADGLAAVTAVAEENQLPLTGARLWEEWLAALAIHNHPQAPAIYRLGNGRLDTAAMTQVATFPFTASETVNQYAADYYEIESSTPLTLTFEGSRRARLVETAPPSGSHFWYANRANYSHMRLSRPVDLRPVVSATLVYSVWHDIEYGYDFAYLAASTDGGETWAPLVAEQMQGLVAADNPAGKALAPRFYTGQSDGWLAERVDLTPYAGQQVWLRFSYVTDPILTFDGLALDNVSIPEIGFYDDAEDAAGWQAAGFTRATPTLPQAWHLQLITFDAEGAPVVNALSLNEAGTLTWQIPATAGGEAPILIVAASAPLTLHPAAYHLTLAN